MQCPSCGLSVDQPTPNRCPRCGRTLARAPGESPASADPPPPDTPPQNSYGPFTPYGAYLPPSGYGQPYGYGPPPAAPSYAPSGYPQPTPPAVTSPRSPRKKPRTKLIVSIVAVVVVVLSACGWGVVATVQALHLPTTVSAIPHETPNEVYSNDFSSSPASWAESPRCFWKSDGYHVSDRICYAPIGNYSDIDIKVTVKQIYGPTNHSMGIAFRLLDNGTSNRFYDFAITSDGHWAFGKCDYVGRCASPLNLRSSSAIDKGIGASNTLEVYAKGAHMDLLINGMAVGSVEDSSYSTGLIGLQCNDGMECVFTTLVIGELD